MFRRGLVKAYASQFSLIVRLLDLVVIFSSGVAAYWFRFEQGGLPQSCQVVS